MCEVSERLTSSQQGALASQMALGFGEKSSVAGMVTGTRVSAAQLCRTNIKLNILTFTQCKDLIISSKE